MLIGASPFALAVYASWLMLMVLVEDFPVVDRRYRQAGIREIRDILSQASTEVQVLLDWPPWMLDVGEGRKR